MKDTKSFLRYIIPGVLFINLMLFMLWIVFPKETISVFKRTLIEKENSLAIIVGSIFTSGALGYLFASIHHWCHWTFKRDRDVINHDTQIQLLINKGLLKAQTIRSPDEKKEALIIMSTEWFKRLGKKNPIGNSDIRVAAYGDLAHAAGAARAASFFALLMSLIICMLYGEPDLSIYPLMRFIIMVAFGYAIIYLFDTSWRNTGSIFQELNNQILEDTLDIENRKRNRVTDNQEG